MQNYYGLICNLLILDLKITMKILIRQIFLRLEMDGSMFFKKNENEKKISDMNINSNEFDRQQ